MSPRALFVLLLAVYLGAAVWTTRRVTATGDEPEYFMAADALVHGEGFDLSSRFAAIATSSYAPAVPISASELDRTTVPSLTRDGRYPRHDLGLALLMALPYALGGRALVVACVAASMAAALAVSLRGARAFGATPRLVTIAALAAGLSVPAITYSGQVYPDAIAPLAVAVAFAGGASSRWTTGVAIAALPFLHLRYWPIVIGLLAIAVARSRRERSSALPLLLPVALALVALAALDLAVYGVALPHAGLLLTFTASGDALANYITGGVGLLGLFVDRAFGWVPAAPLALLLFIGGGAALSEGRMRSLLALAAIYLVPAAFLDWTGGVSPQSRYLVPLVPLAVALYARAFGLPGVRLLAVPLAVWTIGQSAVYVVAPWLRYDVYGVPPLADAAWLRVVGVTPGAVFPLLGSDGASAPLVLAWAGVLAVAIAYGFVASRERHSPPPASAV